MKYFLQFVLLLTLVIPAFARRHSTLKFFPATPESVLRENEIANKMGAERYMDEWELNLAITLGNLVRINEYPSLRVQPSLPENRRYARPATVEFIQLLSSEFFQQFGHPLMVDSATRPASVQFTLRRHNKSAAPAFGDAASSHERGTTLDISRKMCNTEYRWLVYRLLYYRGLGKILVIEERHCLHIFVGEIYE